MDLYSAAKRLAQPYVFTDDDRDRRLPIDARGLIGDGSTAALVRVDGTIDWLCFPRFDSAAVFAGILDSERGGSTGIAPVARHFEALQRYDTDTNVLETLFRVPGQGVMRLIDYMPWNDDPRASIHEVHRRIEVLDGDVEVYVHFDPRFDYGRAKTAVVADAHGVLATGDGDRLAAVVSHEPVWGERPAGGVETRFSLRTGQRRWMVLSWDAVRPEPIAAYRPFEHLRITRQAWRRWANQLRYDGPWRHHVLRSALAIKLLIHAPTGGMVAAPTTSLPEWIGGVRNWDYRYTWTRDTAMAIRATNLIGYRHEARDFFHFMRRALEDSELRLMYAIDGTPVPDEIELGHLRGYRGSGPVRIGNAARDQLQLDVTGALVDAAYLYERFDGVFALRTWRQLRRVVDGVVDAWQQPDEGIWEPRGVRRHNVHSKLMCWLALDRASRLAPRFGDKHRATLWQEAAARVHRDVLRNGMSKDGSHFTAAYGLDAVDSALLLLPLHGFLEGTDPRVTNNIERVRRELGTGPYVYRYKTHDGVGGLEGAFTLCGFWLAEALAMSGRLDEAREIFTAHVEASNHLGLLAEEIDPGSHTQLGNFPQAFSHLGLINAATRIDLALRMRDEGVEGVPHVTEWLETRHR